MVQVLTNAPPSSGNFSVSPLIGSELKTSFKFLASYWMDEDFPIYYQFGFSSDIGNNIVQDKSVARKGDSPLPAGHSSFGFQILCYVKVFDFMNAYSFKYFRVVVNTVDDAEISDLIARRVANASVSQLIQTISVVSFALNSVSCFDSPNCFARNRQNCSTVRDTCGSCYPGFIGEDGSHNSHCSSKNELSRIVNIGVGNTLNISNAYHYMCLFIFRYKKDYEYYNLHGSLEKLYLNAIFLGYCIAENNSNKK
jgi:hypothetical protein